MKPLPSTDNSLPAIVIVASVALPTLAVPPIIVLTKNTMSVTFN